MNSFYRCLKHQQFEEGPYQLVPLREEDIQKIKDWRNSQMTILRQNEELTAKAQVAYYHDVVAKSFAALQPDILLFSDLFDGRCIGYGGLVRIDWSLSQAEVSFLVETERSLDAATYAKDFSRFLQLIKKVAFEEVFLKKIFTETYESRTLHIAILESEGFVLKETLKSRVTKNGKTMDAFIHVCENEGLL